jgi:hypothetical protein
MVLIPIETKLEVLALLYRPAGRASEMKSLILFQKVSS